MTKPALFILYESYVLRLGAIRILRIPLPAVVALRTRVTNRVQRKFTSTRLATFFWLSDG